jgi:hypothetical protein
MGDTASMFYALSPRTVPKDLSQGPPSPMLCPQGPVMLCPQGPSPRTCPKDRHHPCSVPKDRSPRTAKDRQGPPQGPKDPSRVCLPECKQRCLDWQGWF